MRVLHVWPSFHLQHFDMMEEIGRPVVLPEIEWVIGRQSDSKKIIKGIDGQSIFGLSESFDGLL